MDVDILKTSASDSSSMDMISMMMQMEKFPPHELLCDPFYNNLHYPENEYFSGAINSNVAPLTLINPPSPTTSNYLNNPLMTAPFQPNPSFPLEKKNSMAAMREMIFRMAVMQPIQIDPESVKPPKRRNVKISKDPQSVAARHRRERISEKIRILQRLVPGGTKMDTASMLDEAIHYVKFLKKQVQTLEQAGASKAKVLNNGFDHGFKNFEKLDISDNRGHIRSMRPTLQSRYGFNDFQNPYITGVSYVSDPNSKH